MTPSVSLPAPDDYYKQRSIDSIKSGSGWEHSTANHPSASSYELDLTQTDPDASLPAISHLVIFDLVAGKDARCSIRHLQIVYGS